MTERRFPLAFSARLALGSARTKSLTFLPASTRDLLAILDQPGALPGDWRLLEPRGVP
jgi:hypothetical protein